MGRKRGRLRNGVVKLVGRKNGRIPIWVCRGSGKERRGKGRGVKSMGLWS